MANVAKKKSPEKEMVVVNIPLVKNEPDTLFVSVNEKTYSIKKGVDVKVPRFVYDMIIDNQEQAKRNIMFINETKNLTTE